MSSYWDINDTNLIKKKYKETLQNHKLKIAKISKLIKNAKNDRSRINYEEKMNEMKLKFYKERKEKFGFYEKMHQLTQKYTGKRNITKEQFIEWKKWQKSLLGKAERAYNRFFKGNKNLDFSKVSVVVKNKYGSEKFSLTYLLNQTQKVFPTNTREFEDLKKVSNKAFDRLKHIKVKKSKYWKNVSMHLGDIYTNAGKGYDKDGNEIEYDKDDFDEDERQGGGKLNDNDDNDDWDVDEFNDLEDERFENLTDEDTEDALIEFEGDKPNDNKLNVIKYYAGFKITFNVSNTDLIEDIEVHERDYVSMSDYDDLVKYIDKYKFPNKVNMNRLKASIKRMETWRKKRMEKEKYGKDWWRKRN